MALTRRSILGTLGTLGVGVLAGCSGLDFSGSPTPSETVTESAVPLSDQSLYLGQSVETMIAEIDRGAPEDGIPSIDDPQFQSAGEASLADGDPVFGVVRNGEAKAYPRRILAHHEIVNDTVGGDSVAVTYCPLTGTAQGFERGEVEFGVSGRLVNSNLTMYDRATDTWWPQMVATGIQGPLQNEQLREFRVVWTTWGEWRETHSGTRLLTEDTGYVRDYDDDPYGQYNPRDGYYANERLLFDPIVSDDRADPKRVVIGTRTTEGALIFDKQSVLEEGVLTGQIGDTEYVAVAEPSLSTGYVYANPDEAAVESVESGYRVDGETHAADALPLARSLAFDGMWFAWAGFYPEAPYVS